MPQDIDGAIARRRQASGLARLNSLIMRPTNAAKRRPVTLPPSRGATAQDSAPDDDLFQVRKPATFACGLWSESRARHILHLSSAQCKAKLEGAVEEIVAVIIRICATLLRIAQGRPQSCNPPGRNGFEWCSIHLIPPSDCFSPTMQDPEFPPSTVAGLFRRMFWQRLTGNAPPPGISSCLERLTAPAIALIELAQLDPRSVDLLDPAAGIIMR